MIMSSPSSRITVQINRLPIAALDVPPTPHSSYKVHSDDDDETPRPTHRLSESASPRSAILPGRTQRKATSVIALRLSSPTAPSPRAFQVHISPPSPIALRCSLVAAASPRNSFLMTSTTFRTQGFSIGPVGLFQCDRSSPSQTRFAVHKGRPSAFVTTMATSFSDFELLGDSGRGASASVLKALRLDRIGLYVLKSIDVYSQEKRRQLVKELTTFADLQSASHVVQFFGAYYSEGRAMLVLEFMNRGSLQACVERIGPLPPGVVLHFARQIFAGLAHLHSRHLVHRDVKPGNVLVSRRGRLKLTDFGISETVRSSSPYLDGFVGTQIYMSPERLEGAPYGTPADIWSAGLVLAFAALGQHPYSGADGFFGIVQQIRTEPIPAVPDRFPDGFRHLLACCLQEQPEQRWTAAELMQHPILEGIDTDDVLDWDLNQTTVQDDADLSRIANVLVEKKYKNIDEPIQEALHLEDLLELSRTLEIEPTDIRKAVVAAYCHKQRQ